MTQSISATSNAAGVVNFATGVATGDGTAITITLGFIPRHIRIFNTTDAIIWEKTEGMVAANSVKSSNGALAVDTSSQIVINTDGTVTLGATLGASGKALDWAAWG